MLEHKLYMARRSAGFSRSRTAVPPGRQLVRSDVRRPEDDYSKMALLICGMIRPHSLYDGQLYSLFEAVAPHLQHQASMFMHRTAHQGYILQKLLNGFTRCRDHPGNKEYIDDLCRMLESYSGKPFEYETQLFLKLCLSNGRINIMEYLMPLLMRQTGGGMGNTGGAGNTGGIDINTLMQMMQMMGQTAG